MQFAEMGEGPSFNKLDLLLQYGKDFGVGIFFTSFVLLWCLHMFR